MSNKSSKEDKIIHNIQLDSIALANLIDLLLFAGNAAVLLSSKDLDDTLGSGSASMLKKAALYAEDLVHYLETTTNIGEPIPDVKH